MLRGKFNKNEKEYDQANYIYKHTKILIKLFKDIMSYSALESGDFEINREEIALLNMLDKLASKYSVKIVGEYKKNIELLVDVKEDFKNAVFKTDRDWISKIFEELISNSIKYTLEGTITIGYEIDYEQITFFVKDTGVGIPVSEKENVMNSFTHGDNLYVSLHKGTGLGLNIIRSLVNHLGGEIRFKSKEGSGTSFYFSFSSVDVKDYILNNKNVEILPFPDLLIGKKIIIAEDNDNSYDYLNSLLHKEADEISRVKSEKELMDLLKNKNKTYDLILYDIYIPKLNNLSNIHAIKGVYPEAAIIALVANEDEVLREKDRDFDAIVKKTISKNKLYETIKTLFS